MLPTTTSLLLRLGARRSAPTAAAASSLLPALLSPPHHRPSFSSTSGTAAPSPRRLADILHLEKLAGASGAEVAAIWMDFHDASKKKKEAPSSPTSPSFASSTPHAFRLGTTLPAADYAAFRDRAKASPLIALPVAKAVGGDDTKALLTLLAQAQLPHLLIGTLGEFRDSGPAAPAHAIVTHYDELAAEKGVVLVRTDLVSPHVLSPAEVERVVATIHALYLDDTPGGGHSFVRAFNHAPAGFDWEGLCKHVGVEV